MTNPTEPGAASVSERSLRDALVALMAAANDTSRTLSLVFPQIPLSVQRNMRSEHHVQVARLIEAMGLAKEALTTPARSSGEIEWREAVIDELVVAHIYSASHDTDPRKAIADAIAWNVQVALDPLVSEDAQKLIAAARSSGLPNGWVAVPRTLHPDMQEAVVQLDMTASHDPLWPEYWAVMLAAAPALTPNANEAAVAGDDRLREALTEVGRKLMAIENTVPIAKDALGIVMAALTPNANEAAVAGDGHG